MMRFPNILFIISVLIYHGSIGQKAQTNFLIKPLKIGDYIPDVELEKMINYKSGKAKLSDFKGKFIILDFWNKNCSVCIEAFPKMEKLQQKFSNKIQVLLVTEDNMDVIKDLSRKSKNVKNIKLPIVLEEKLLHAYFPTAIGFPWYAIINDSNRVVATTTILGMTENNIQALLNRKPTDVNFIVEQLIDFDENEPLIIEGNGRHWDRIEYYSMIMRAMPQLVSRDGRLKHPITKNTINEGLCLFELPMILLYSYAYGDGYIIVEDENASRYFIPENDGLHFNYMYNHNFKSTQCFTYEQIMPKGKEHLSKVFMQSDLEKYFGYTAVKEKRKIKCHILYRLDSIDRISTKYTEETFDKSFYPLDVRDSVDKIMKYRYNPMSNILARMYGGAVKMKTYNAPVLMNETGFKEDKKVDMHFTVDLSNLPLLQEEIRKFGLGIKIEERDVECLVLKKNQFWINPVEKK